MPPKQGLEGFANVVWQHVSRVLYESNVREEMYHAIRSLLPRQDKTGREEKRREERERECVCVCV
jgi:hypothetical protein